MPSIPFDRTSPDLARVQILAIGFGLFVAAGCATNPSLSPAAKGAGPAGVDTNPPPTASLIPVAASDEEELTLFDGKTLTGWAITDFAGHGEVRIENEELILGNGIMTGVTWTNDLPRMNYEISLEARRVDGNDFFCGLTFPVNNDPCSFIVGGWGGGVVGLSSLDGEDAAHNDTTQYMNFDNGRWFKIRLRVRDARIQAWIDEDKVVDVDTTGRKVSIRVEVEPSKPLGFATWSTTGALRKIKLRRLPSAESLSPHR